MLRLDLEQDVSGMQQTPDSYCYGQLRGTSRGGAWLSALCCPRRVLLPLARHHRELEDAMVVPMIVAEVVATLLLPRCSRHVVR